MTEEWIRAMAATHVDVDEALAEAPRLVHLAVRLAAVSGALVAEVERLQAMERRAREVRNIFREGSEARDAIRYILGLEDS